MARQGSASMFLAGSALLGGCAVELPTAG